MLTTLLSTLVFGLTTAIPFSSSPAILARRSLEGPATHYEGNLNGSACQFTQYTLPAGVYGTALAVSNWNNAYNCGGCVQITNQNGVSITAMIVDECMTCGQNGLDLFPDAFAVMDPGSGLFPVTWDYVHCPVALGNLRIHMQSGSNEYWFAAQVTNAIRRTAFMEVSTDGGATWMPTARSDYNYFVIEQGTGSGNVDVRVTSHMNTVVHVPNVPVYGGAVTEAAANYE